MNSLPQPHYNEDQAKLMDSRVMHDAELIMGGARHNTVSHLGGLAVTEDQINALHYEHIEKPIKEAAEREFALTPESQQIDNGKKLLDYVQYEVDVALGGAIALPIFDKEEQEAYKTRDFAKLDRIGRDKSARLTRDLQENGINVDLLSLKRIAAPGNLKRADQPVRDITYVLDVCGDRLDELAYALPTLPHLRIGNRVTVQRAANDRHPEPYFETDWTINRIRGDGLIIAQSSDGRLEKPVDLDNLLAWNPVEQSAAEQ